MPSWLKSSRTVPQAGSVAKGGGNSSPGTGVLGGKEVMHVLREAGAGQGAHREVGSEGFAANRRAVAEQGEPVGQIQVLPSRHYSGEGNTWGAWAHKGVCGRHGGEGTRVTSGDLVRSCSTGQEIWAYKPPQRSRRRCRARSRSDQRYPGTEEQHKPRDRLQRETAGGDSKGADQGEGVTSGMVNSTAKCGRVGASGLMVAAAMTEALTPRGEAMGTRIPTRPDGQAG